MSDKIKLTDIVWEPKIYPREKWSTRTIEQYADVLKSGNHLPPIVVEKGTNRLLDGKHRVEAHKLYAQWYSERQSSFAFQNGVIDIWPEPSEEIAVEFHTIPNGVPPKLYAASLSTKHGDRIKPDERKTLAREVYEDNPDFNLADLMNYLGVSLGSAHNYVADILARRKEALKMIAFRLDLLGWTQQEIADCVVSSQEKISRILDDFSELKKSIKKLLAEGHPHLDVAERQNMPLQLVWAIDMEGRTDKERMERLNINIQPYDAWHFAKCHDLFGSQHPGRIPGELIAHVLYFYAKPGAMVIDPMVGSGTTLDVCLAFGRKCYGFDIDDRHERSDVIKHDIIKDGWHERVKKADLIFWDPPYYSKMDSSTIGEDGYIEGSISKLSRADYLDFFADRFFEAKKMVKNGTKLAFLMSDWDDDTGKREGIFIWHYADLIQKAGWKLLRHIQAPLSTQQIHPDIVNKFRESRRLARLERYLLIAEA